MTSPQQTMDGNVARRTTSALFPVATLDATRGRAYAETALVVVGTTALSYVFREHLLGPRLLILWLMSIALAWRWGLRYVLMGSVAALVLWNVFVLEPVGAFTEPTVQQWMSVGVYFVVSLILGRAFDSVRIAERRYRALIEASTVMVWNSDASGRVTQVPLWQEITGQSTAELETAGWVEALHPEDRAHAVEEWATAQRNITPLEVEYRLRVRDGSHRWFQVRATPVYDGDRVAEWVGVIQDVHDRRVDAERHAAVEHALAVLGVSLDYEWNLAAVTRLLVPALADYCSVDILDASGAIRRVSSTHADPVMEDVLRTMWTKYPYREEDPGAPAVIRSGEGMLMPSIEADAILSYTRSEEHREMMRALGPRSFLCVPMRSRGVTFGALSLVFSTSGRSHSDADRVAVEQVATRAATAIENARLYAEAQSASRAKSDFLATMSHELRTPLNAIAGYADLLMMGVRGPITEEQRRDLARIRQNQQHLLEIITDILNFSRIESGRSHYSLSDVELRGVLERMEGVIEPQAKARSVTYVYESSSAPITVRADREKLEQVLINLLGNAVKFTPAGGEIRLSSDIVDSRVRIMVRDTGIGIPPEHLDRVFEPFVQLEPALRRTSEGTGLGLAISRELARGMGGDLRAESTPGAGSIFYVELPHIPHAQ